MRERGDTRMVLSKTGSVWHVAVDRPERSACGLVWPGRRGWRAETTLGEISPFQPGLICTRCVPRDARVGGA